MSHPDYINIGSEEDKVVEECSELIKEIIKARRFGLFNFHPAEPNVLNIDRIRREMEDLNNAIERLDVKLRQEQHEFYTQEAAVKAAKGVDYE